MSDLADVVDEQVAFLTQDGRCVHVLLGEQVEPQCEAVHHGQAQHPQELQHVQDPLHRITAGTCSNSRCEERYVTLSRNCKKKLQHNLQHHPPLLLL